MEQLHFPTDSIDYRFLLECSCFLTGDYAEKLDRLKTSFMAPVKKHEEFLSPTSNILDFPQDFDIFASYAERPVPPRRIFGKHCTHLPRDTSLRRAYADWLLTGHTCGFGHGMILFDGEKIVNNAREK